MSLHRLGTIDDFPENKGKKCAIDGIEIAVLNIAGELTGIQNRCAHKNLPLHVVGEPRFHTDEYRSRAGDRNEEIRGAIDVDEFSINCPWHYLEWDLETGCNQQTGKCIATYDIVVDDEVVYVDL